MPQIIRRNRKSICAETLQLAPSKELERARLHQIIRENNCDWIKPISFGKKLWMLVICTFSHVLYNLLLGRGPTVAFPLVCGCKDRLCWDICPAKIGWCTLHGAARCSLGPAPTGRNFIICGHLIWRAISSISSLLSPLHLGSLADAAVAWTRPCTAGNITREGN